MNVLATYLLPIAGSKDSQNLQIHAITFASIRQFSSVRIKNKCVDCEVSQTGKDLHCTSKGDTHEHCDSPNIPNIFNRH